jgi:DNA primase
VRAFTEDRNFVTQTFVAVQPDGLDPCELWQAKGPDAVRDLVAHRVPLSEFVVRGVLAGFDLATPEGRVAALRAAAPLVARTKDRSLRPEYARSLAGWLGMEVEPVMAAVSAAGRADAKGAGDTVASGSIAGRPRPDDTSLMVDREALKTVLQYPQLSGTGFDELPPEAFRHPAYVAVRQSVEAAGGAASASSQGLSAEQWVARVRDASANDAVRSVVTELTVEPLRVDGEPDARYVDEQLGWLQERMVQRQVAEVRSRLQRIDPTQAEEYQKVFGELVGLEQRRRLLRERAVGGA